MWIFVLSLPLAIISQFAEIGQEVAENLPILGDLFMWLSIPFYAAVAWVFHTMERIGRTGENPFEGSANDVPVSTIARVLKFIYGKTQENQKMIFQNNFRWYMMLKSSDQY